MKGTEKRNIAVAALMAVILLICAFPHLEFNAKTTQEKLNEAQQEKKETEDKKNQSEDQLDDLNATTDNLKGQLNNLNTELTQVSDDLAALEKQIADKEAEIETTTKELTEAKATEQSQYAAMKKRIQFMYESQDYVLLEMLFSSADFSTFLNQSDYMEALMGYDRKQLEIYKQTRASIEEKEETLNNEKAELDDYKEQVVAKQNEVSGLVSQTSGSISNYQGQIAKTEAEVEAYEAQIAEQNANITELKKQLEEERRLSALAAISSWRDISQVTFAEGDRYLLANLIYCEAGNQPYEGQVAVGAVVMNRVMSSVFPDTMVGVIYQNKQFAPVASGRLALALARDDATAACYSAADAAMGGTTTVGNCLFFRTPIEGLTGTQIGGHIFY